jgi:hypothetical protein
MGGERVREAAEEKAYDSQHHRELDERERGLPA